MAYYRGEPVKTSSNNAVIFLIILCLVFAAIIIILLFENSNAKTKLIAPENCPKIKGNYGVIPNVDKTTLGNPINSCNTAVDPNGNGSLGTSVCTFAASSVLQAENICNNFPSVCNGFYYTPPTSSGGSGSMTFYNTSFTPTSQPLGVAKTVVDVYTKQL
jgi:hypothetical protein